MPGDQIEHELGEEFEPEIAIGFGDVEAVFYADIEEFYAKHGILNPEELAQLSLDDLTHVQQALTHERIETETQIECIQTEILRRQTRKYNRPLPARDPEGDIEEDVILTDEEFWELMDLMEPGEWVDFLNEETHQLPSSILEWYRGFLLHQYRNFAADQFNLDEALQKILRKKRTPHSQQ